MKIPALPATAFLLLALGTGLAIAQGFVPASPVTNTTAVTSSIAADWPPPQANAAHPLTNEQRPFILTRGYEVADLNGDGKPDIVVCPYYYIWQPRLPIMILLNRGDGTFMDGTAQLIQGPIPTTGSLNNIFIRDFNGDGKPDILIVDQGLEDKDPNAGFDGGKNILLLSQPNGRLQDVSVTAFAGQVDNFNHVSAMGDVNGDGSLDVVIPRLGGPRTPTEGVVLLLNNGSGTFTESSADLPEEIRLRPRFAQTPGVDYQRTGSVGVGDLDGDGRLDLVSASYSYPDVSRRRTVRIHQRSGNAGFVETARVDIPAAIANIPYFAGGTIVNGEGGLGAARVVIADFNADGRQDILVVWEGSLTSYFQFLRNDGSWTFTDTTAAWWGNYVSHASLSGSTQPAAAVEARDINGDGIPDLVIRRAVVNMAAAANSAIWYLNDGSGRMTPWRWLGADGNTVATSTIASSLGCGACDYATFILADVDGDGIEDPVYLVYSSNFPALPARATGFDVRAFRSTRPSALPTAVQDLWWAGSAENGWGMSISQHRDTLFAVFYVYDAQGNPVWYVMPGGSWNAAHTTFTGNLYLTRGAPFSAYNASQFQVGSPVGTASIAFAGNYAATVGYSINGVTGSKAITRQPIAAGASLYRVDDLWWGGASQDGWGINVTQQGNALFAVWYTYDAVGAARWYVMSGGAWSNNRFAGTLYTTRSSAWVGVPYSPDALTVNSVGSMSFTFLTPDSAMMTYEVGGVRQTKPIVRQSF